MSDYVPPDAIVKDLYLEITNISQGVNVAIFVYVLTTPEFSASVSATVFSTLLIAIASLLIVVVFWVRYYLDTAILNRSFTSLSVTWFFAYVVVQGLSISLISRPPMWFFVTSLFLFFGAGFYILNLREIRRKQRAGLLLTANGFVRWQEKRLIELVVLSAASFCGGLLVTAYSGLALPAAIVALGFALWQIAVTEKYRTFKFIEAGV
ncbi:MAG: hypothetical protein WA009_09600 [Phototrophicaceae bacterium]|nr:hypothetical protein [Anaerolineae bacterium]